MILFKNKEECYGCGACANSCPKKAIDMVPDEKGFLYPRIDTKVCIDCGICRLNCQIGREKDKKNPKVNNCIGFKNLDSIRMLSSSGGAYTALSDQILCDGGICYGTVLSDSNDVIYDKARTKEKRDLFLGSKYVQSFIGNTYQDVFMELKTNNKVLFTGTPCQVAGLNQYLLSHKVSSQNLLTIDLLCHGVPSPKLWKDYIKLLELKNDGKVEFFTFRNKEKGWTGYHVKVKYNNGTTECDSSENVIFTKLFSTDLALRPSCYRCPYACKERCGDITIGDFWGIQTIDSQFADNRGISLVILNNEKGRRAFKDILSNSLYKYKKYDLSSIKQDNLSLPTLKNLFTDLFWKQYQTKGFLWVAEVYTGFNNDSFFNRMLRSIMYRIHSFRNKWRSML